MTQQQSKKTQSKDLPCAGETYRCNQCGMELEIKQDCRCDQGSPLMACCGQPMTKV